GLADELGAVLGDRHVLGHIEEMREAVVAVDTSTVRSGVFRAVLARPGHRTAAGFIRCTADVFGRSGVAPAVGDKVFAAARVPTAAAAAGPSERRQAAAWAAAFAGSTMVVAG